MLNNPLIYLDPSGKFSQVYEKETLTGFSKRRDPGKIKFSDLDVNGVVTGQVVQLYFCADLSK